MALGLLVWLGQPADEPAVLRWLPDAATDFDEWLETDPGAAEDPCPLRLEASGIHAFDDREVLLYGHLDTAPGAYRSFLLRSADGGASWSEVMPPLPGSSVLDVSFTSPARGRALVGWVVEGPGQLWVYGTENGGRSWTRLAEVAKPHNLDLPMSLTCLDAQRCRLTLECVNAPEGYGHVLESGDGGRRWRVRKQAASFLRPEPEPDMVTPDGTPWRIASSEDGHELHVLKQPAGETAWTALPRIRQEYRRPRGEGLVACEPGERDR